MPSTAVRTPPRRAPLRPAPPGRSVRAMAVVWVAWVVLMAGVNLPTPLYAVYSQRVGFSSALLAGLAQAGGSGAGPLIAGLLAEWAPDPLRLPYFVLLGATALVALCALRIPEPLRGRSGRWQVTRPAVPAGIRRPFARVALTAAVLWAAVALFLSIVPSYAAKLLQTSNLALLGV